MQYPHLPLPMMQGSAHAAEANLDACATIGSPEPKAEDSSSFSSPRQCCHSVSQHRQLHLGHSPLNCPRQSSIVPSGAEPWGSHGSAPVLNTAVCPLALAENGWHSPTQGGSELSWKEPLLVKQELQSLL